MKNAENEQDFIRLHRSDWLELEQENKYFAGRRSRFRNGLSRKAPTKERIDRYMELYRTAANHLAYVRTFWGETETAGYLNTIVGDAHSVIYSKTVFRFGDVFSFIGTGFPRLFRANVKYFFCAMLAFVLPALIAYVYVRVNPENALAFLSEDQLSSIRQEGNYDLFNALKATLEGLYIGGNNIIVCLESFAGGITLGLFTIYALVSNGILLGALGGYCGANGSGAFFWSLILPHGVTELFAIWLSGMAGFMIGYALINPRGLTRRTALAVQGKKAVKIVLIGVLFLIPSALIESFFTPLEIPYAVKYLFAAGMAVLVIVYLLIGIRKDGRNARAGNGKPASESTVKR